MMMMSSVAAIRQKFQEQDIVLSPPSPLATTLTSIHGKSTPKHESLFKPAATVQRPIGSKPTSAHPPSIKFQKNPNAENKTRINHGSRTIGAAAAKASEASRHAELNRSSSLTDIAISASETFKRSDSITSFSTSDDALNKKLNQNVVSEIKSLFESSNRNVLQPVNKSDNRPKVPGLKPNMALSGTKNLNSQGDVIKKAKKLGSEVIQSSSPSSATGCHLSKDVSSSISTSTSSLSKVSTNSVIDKQEPSYGAFLEHSSMEQPNLNVKRICYKRQLPNILELGPPPPKPAKPHILRSPPVGSSSYSRTSSPQETLVGKNYPSVNFNVGLPPKRPPPKPPSESGGKPLPPLPLQEDFYDDSQNVEKVNNFSNNSPKGGNKSTKNNTIAGNGHSDELYNDIANDPEFEDDIYETMEVDPSQCDQFQRYAVEERKLSCDFKENDKEMLKLKEKFQLTGEELSIAKGMVKKSTKAKGNDLAVKEGEQVIVYRMEKNPTGRWLVKNERGKFGYVELNNIEIDPQFVKSVMQTPRYSDSYYQTPRSLLYLQADDDELYQDVQFPE